MIMLPSFHVLRQKFIACALLFSSCMPLAAATSQGLFFEAENSFYDKNYEATLIKLDEFLKTNPDDLAAEVLKARSFIAIGEPELAITTFEKILQLGADETIFAVELARARNEANRFKDNIRLIQADKFPADIASALYSEKGYAYLGSNEVLMAEKQFNAAIRLDPGSADALTGRATIALLRKDYPKAFSLLEVVTRNNPFHHRSQFAMGLLEHSRQQESLAINYYRNALKIRPNHAATRVALISALLDVEDYSAAETLLNKSIKLQQWVPQYHYLAYRLNQKTSHPTKP